MGVIVKFQVSFWFLKTEDFHKQFNNNCIFIDNDNMESSKHQIFSSLIFILKIFGFYDAGNTALGPEFLEWPVIGQMLKTKGKWKKQEKTLTVKL